MKQLFTNGRIHQNDPARFARAVLVVNGKIDHIFFDEPTHDPVVDERIDLNGAYLFPAFEDAHTHPGSRCRTLSECVLDSSLSWQQARDHIAAFAQEHSQRDIIVAHGWNQAAWGIPSPDALSQATGNKPLFLMNISYHGGLLNRAAEQWFADRGAGFNVRDGLIEEADFDEAAVMTLPQQPELENAIRAYNRKLLSLGVATVHDMYIATERQLDAYTTLDRRHELQIETYAYLDAGLLKSPRAQEFVAYQGNKFHVAGLKIFLDGAIGLHTARLSRPYKDRSTQGLLLVESVEFEQTIQRALDLGLRQIAVHAIGDAAVATILDALEHFKTSGVDVTSWRIEHCEMIGRDDLDRLAGVNVTPVMQPNFHWDLHNYADRLDEEQLRLINPFRLVLDRNIPLTFGSDGMPEGPLIGLNYAMNQYKFEEQRLTLSEALHAYTQAPANLVGAGARRGSITKGKDATFVLLDKNPFEYQNALRNVQVLTVWHQGHLLYDHRNP